MPVGLEGPHYNDHKEWKTMEETFSNDSESTEYQYIQAPVKVPKRTFVKTFFFPLRVMKIVLLSIINDFHVTDSFTRSSER